MEEKNFNKQGIYLRPNAYGVYLIQLTSLVNAPLKIKNIISCKKEIPIKFFLSKNSTNFISF